MRTIYIDGRYLKVSDQIIQALTPGNFKAKGVFETLLGLRVKVLDIAPHLKRLRAGLKTLRIKAPAINPSILKEVLRRNHLDCARVRLMVWQSGKDIHWMVAALPYKIPQEIYRVCIIKTSRPANKRWAQVKSLDYGLFARAYARAQIQGFDEALLLNSKNHIFEACRANLFWIKGKVLYTTPLSSGCLNGITRQQVMEQANILKIPVKERNTTPRTLQKADLAFLTNSLIGLKPIEITH